MRIALEKLTLDNDILARAEVDEIVAAKYGADMQRGDEFPAAVAFDDDVKLWLSDGFHRHRAAGIAGQAALEVLVKKGSRDDAVLFAVTANRKHGKRPSLADRRKSVLNLLKCEKWRANSDRWIAELAEVDHKTVATIRDQLGNSPPETRAGRDGKRYPVKRKPVESDDSAPAISPRAVELVAGTDSADNPRELAELRRLPEHEQLQVTGMVSRGEAESISDAIKKMRKAERRPLDAYYTPPELALAIVRAIAPLCPEPQNILEPSSGGGAFVRALQLSFPKANLIAVDVDPKAQAHAHGVDFWAKDFAKWDTPRRFDLIVGNPPFGVAATHVSRALELLQPGGLLAFLLRVTFLGTEDRKDINAGPGRLLRPLVPRPSFTEDSATDPTEYALFCWRKDSAEPSLLGDPLVWPKPSARSAAA